MQKTTHSPLTRFCSMASYHCEMLRAAVELAAAAAMVVAHQIRFDIYCFYHVVLSHRFHTFCWNR